MDLYAPPAIGGPIAGATAGSILFAASGGLFAQDNANFQWVDADNSLILASTPPASTTKASLLLGSALSGGSSSGTFLGINAPAAYPGDLAHFQTDGLQGFVVTGDGKTVVGPYRFNEEWTFPLLVTGDQTSPSNFGPSIAFVPRVDPGSGYNYGELAFGLYNPLAPTPVVQTISIGGEGVYDDDGTFGVYGMYVYDYNVGRYLISALSTDEVAVGSNAGLGCMFSVQCRDASIPGAILKLASTPTANAFELWTSASVVLASVSAIGASLFRPLDAETSTVTIAQTLGHSSSGTPAAGYGGEQRMTLQSSTTADRAAAGLSWEWATATDASRKARLTLSVYDTAVRNALQIDTNGTVAYGLWSGDPPASASLSKLGLGSAISGGDSDGTYLGVNAGSGFAGDFLLFQTNNAFRFSVRNDGLADAAGTLRARGNTPPSVGAGLELLNNSGTCFVQAYDRDASNFLPLQLSASAITFNAAVTFAVGNLNVPGTGNSFIGDLRFTSSDASNTIWHSTGGTIAMTTAGGDIILGAGTTTDFLHLYNANGTAAFQLRDGGTNSVTQGLRIRHNTSGTAAAGFGNELRFQLESSTTEDRDAGGLSWEWATATDASRKALVKLLVYDTAVREVMRGEASGTAPMIGFLGAAAVVRQTAAADATDLATVIALANSLKAGLVANGLFA